MSSPVESPVVGTVWKIEKKVGHAVAVGDVVMIIESMKMEIPVEAEYACVIENIMVNEGDPVGEGDTLATIV